MPCHDAALAGPHRIFDARAGLFSSTNWTFNFEALAFGDAQPVWLTMCKVESIGMLNVAVIQSVPCASPLGKESGVVVSLWTSKVNAKVLLEQNEVL